MTDTRQALLNQILSIVAQLEGETLMVEDSEELVEDELMQGNISWDEEQEEYVDTDGDVVTTCPITPSVIIEDALDIVYMSSPNVGFIGAEVTVTTGGPHIYIDTRHDKVVGAWGTDRIERSYTDEIDFGDFMEMLYGM